MIDLHVHTCFSDGEHTPGEVIDIAKVAKVDVLAITDHDSVFGVQEAINEGKKNNINVIPGIEITAFDDEEVHILGYNIDIEDDRIISYVRRIECEREKEVLRIFEALRGMGIDLKEDDVYKFRDGKIITSWHFAMAIVENGYASSISEARERFIEIPAIKRLDFDAISVKDAIALIKDVGGVPVLAHPSRLGFSLEELTKKIVLWKEYGLKGIEAIYSLNSEEENEKFLEVAKKYTLGATIGSDYHGEHVKPSISLGTGVNGSMVKYDFDINDIEILR